MLIFLVILKFCALVNGQFDYTENGDSAEYSKFMNRATKIRNELFTTRKYDKYLAPVFLPLRDSTDERGNLLEGSFSGSKVPKLNINFMLYYLKLFNLDAESQIFSATVEFKMNWRDPRLAWKQEKFGGLDSIYIGTDILWIPDARVGNAKILDPINGLTIPIARVSSNGTVFLTTIFYAETACGINANKFPFDRQNCSLPIISLGLDSKLLSMGVSVERGGKTLVGNGAWDILEAVPMEYQSVSESGKLDVVGYFVIVQRVPNFYVYVIALPCFILVMLSIVGMFWSPNFQKEKLTKLSIGLTSLVSITVLLDMLSNAIPKTQVFPLLGIYVVSCVGMTSLACVLVVLHSMPNPEKATKKEIERLKESDQLKTRSQRLNSWIRKKIYDRNFFFLLCFQLLNVIGFIVFLSFWDG